jgi:hypothetical protein
MSGGGGGPIILKSLQENPGTTAGDKDACGEILAKGAPVSRLDALRVIRIVWRLLRNV